MTVVGGIDLAEPISSYRVGYEITKQRIIVYHEDARTLETWRMDVTVRPPVAWFTLCKHLTADRAKVGHRYI